jgi:hypothetical protein
MDRFFRSIICVLLIAGVTLTAKSQYVYKTPSGAKYHLANCRTVKNVSAKITTAEAAKLGLSPCKICNPPAIPASSPAGKEKGEGTTVQCKGITKKGTRCKHMTRIANGYCFQHGPNR